jgi:CubicO group peptidase (beta-lactamase class C family)
MRSTNASGVLVLKDGKIVLERYGLGRTSSERWTSFSVAKSITAMLVGAAIADGKLRLNEPVTEVIPELKGSTYEGVTLRHLLTMSSGVKWNEDYADLNSNIAKAGEPIEAGVNPFVAYVRKLPRENAPGAAFHYNTSNTDIVGVMVSRATGGTLADYLSRKIWKPYGMGEDAVWMVDYGGQERGGCCISMTLRDYARFGQFVLEGGRVGDKWVVPQDWTREATRVQISNGRPSPAGYGYFWWVGAEAYEASGIFGQSILIYPQDRLVIVINSAWPKAVGDDMYAPMVAFQRAVRAAANALGTTP